ncbi:hypothetical protein BDM02DRAFT_3191179 [Thelephora ganbajun]|uniref:Uncharacterized protein n=1 Tax=Thelephora ganbajun TaxID=370292 RepID=A0ACB6Z2Z0_THEGA|nr:hypothetical protein BDM02DRAFT_3191179 [Thelephora ganbajun]
MRRDRRDDGRAAQDPKNVDLTVRLAGEAERATMIGDGEIEGELCALVKDDEDEKRVAEGRAASEFRSRTGLYELRHPSWAGWVFGEKGDAKYIKFTSQDLKVHNVPREEVVIMTELYSPVFKKTSTTLVPNPDEVD